MWAKAKKILIWAAAIAGYVAAAAQFLADVIPAN